MTSEIRANIIKNRVGLGTIEYSNTGPVISGVTTASNFKTGTSNLHSTGLNIQDLDVDGHTNLDNVSIAGVTTSAGIVQAPQFKLLDNAKAIYGNSGDMEIYHNATNSLIQNGTGSLQIITTTGSLFLRGQDDISLNTAGNNERLRITSTGRVGIGTDNPTKKLEIYVGSSSIKVEGNDAGSFHIDPNSTGGTQEALIGQANGDLRLLAGAGSYQANRANILLKNNGRLELSSNSSSDIIFKSNTVEKVRITSTGRVGIGTDNPDEDLVILDVSPSLKLTSTSTVGNTNIYFGDVAGTTQGQIQYHNNGDFFRFYTNGSNERLRITSTGRVGINTDSPGRLLEINTTGTSTEGIVVKSNDNTYPKLDFGANRTNADAFLGMITANWNGTYVADILFESGSDTTNKDDGLISFRTAESGGSREERLRITSTGDVVIGHTAANGKLQVNNGTNSAVGDSTNPAFQIGGTSTYRLGIFTTNEQAIIANKNGDDGIAFHTKTANSGSFGEAFVIKSDGKVGVNGTPDHQFTVNIDGLSDNSYGFKTSYRSGNNASGYTASGISIISSANDSNGDQNTAFIHFSNRSPALNGSHGAAAFITLTTPDAQGTHGTGEFNFYCRNGSAYGFPNDPQVSSSYWMSSLFKIKSSKELFGYGNLRLDTGGNADGIIGAAYGTSYFGIKQADQGASEYMMINNNSNTYISCTSGYSVYIRPSANSQTHETLFAHDNTTFKTNVVLDTHALRRNQHQWGHMEGGHNNIGSTNTKTSPIYTIGSAYNPNENDLNNMYGIGYCHSDASFINSNVTSGWGQYVASDGDARIFLNAGDGVVYATRYGRMAHNSGHLQGSYNNIGANSAQSNPIYTIGSSYNPAASTLSNMYGIGYTHGNNASFVSFSGLTGWGLYVAADGDARIFLDATTGKIAATSTITQNASDVRLKTNIKVIDNPIEKIKKIRGVTFDWVDNITSEYDFHPDSMHETGVIAQEIQEVIPDAVATAPFNGNYTRKSGTDNNYLTVKNEKIIPLCIEAIKKLTAKVESLEQENTALKARVTSLEE